MVNAEAQARHVVGVTAQNARGSLWNEARRGEVVFSVGELFLNHGYEGVSMGMIVAKTGGSYRDVYKEFGDKEALFRRVVAEICGEVLSPLRMTQSLGAAQSLTIDKALTLVGKAYLSSLLKPNVLALHRLVVTEASRFPELSTLFMSEGPEQAYRTVATLIKGASALEGVKVRNASIEARLFIDMITADFQLRALTGTTFSQSAIDARVVRAVKLFAAGLKHSFLT